MAAYDTQMFLLGLECTDYRRMLLALRPPRLLRSQADQNLPSELQLLILHEAGPCAVEHLKSTIPSICEVAENYHKSEILYNGLRFEHIIDAISLQPNPTLWPSPPFLDVEFGAITHQNLLFCMLEKVDVYCQEVAERLSHQLWTSRGEAPPSGIYEGVVALSGAFHGTHGQEHGQYHPSIELDVVRAMSAKSRMAAERLLENMVIALATASEETHSTADMQTVNGVRFWYLPWAVYTFAFEYKSPSYEAFEEFFQMDLGVLSDHRVCYLDEEDMSTTIGGDIINGYYSGTGCWFELTVRLLLALHGQPDELHSLLRVRAASAGAEWELAYRWPSTYRVDLEGDDSLRSDQAQEDTPLRSGRPRLSLKAVDWLAKAEAMDEAYGNGCLMPMKAPVGGIQSL
ncbi:unnamed protein product [Zymoseptoria tritici ST99CH_1A5]|uniref:Uncharacterized protein n=1 Tax=Zymoseptoria tritici ST99CH_1A5 TaxID=1276529 RepID=A0A1Y6LVG7_ZYMTR|nr:unnamed protein product [Zymoseptoria tritici ST99CH_1A5]